MDKICLDLRGTVFFEKAVARRSRQAFAVTFLEKPRWTKSAWIYAVLFSFQKTVARRSRQALSVTIRLDLRGTVFSDKAVECRSRLSVF